MLIEDLIELLQHTKAEMEKQGVAKPEIVFSYGFCETARDYDYGEKGRTNYNVCVTPYETWAHVDGWKRFVLSLRRIPRPACTPEMNRAWEEGLRKSGLSESAIAKDRQRQEAFRIKMNSDPELQEYKDEGTI